VRTLATPSTPPERLEPVVRFVFTTRKLSGERQAAVIRSMDIKNLFRVGLVALGASMALAQQQPAADQEPLARRILRMSEADQIAYISMDLDQGMPVDLYDPLGMLVLNRSSLVLPMLEKKIEGVLRSPNPLDCFTDKTVNPQKFVDLAAWTIPNAGDEQALRELSKLIAIDEKRFGMLVNLALLNAEIRRNPFAVAYRGFQIGDPAVDKRIAAWAELQFDDKGEIRQGQLKHMWAEAMMEKCGCAPNEVSWANDPIASRIKPALAASLHDEVFRLGADAFAKRAKK